MKVLLIGDYSCFHKYLKVGLSNLGHDVRLFSNGDFWKKIDGYDHSLFDEKTKNPFKVLKSILNSLSLMKGYDVVQLMNPMVYPSLINRFCLKRIFKRNSFVSLVSAGNDLAVIDSYCNGMFDYSPYDYEKLPIKMYKSKSVKSFLYRASDKCAVEGCDVIVPALYEYGVGYSNNPKFKRVIPFPIDVGSIPYSENVVKDKIVFFHGLNREDAKGTRFIRDAFDLLSKKYPDRVECVIKGKLPFNEYVSLMSRVNVVVDQCCSYAYGINACIAMAQGKVVVSGKRKETLDAFGISDCPIIEARPDVQYLFEAMEKIVHRQDMIKTIGLESRKYVEKLHDCNKVALEYMDIWGKKK